MSQRNNRRTKFETYHSKGYLNIELSLLPPRVQCYKKSHGRHLTRGEKSPMSLSLHGSMLTKTLPRWNCVLHTICSHGRIAQSCHCLYSDNDSWVLSKVQQINSKAQHPWLHFLPYNMAVLVAHCFVCLFVFKNINLVVKSACCSSRD